MNPAILSSQLAGLFSTGTHTHAGDAVQAGPGAVAAELRVPGDPSLLLPEEAAHLGRAVAKRVGEFAAGRLCARRALAEFGIRDFPIRAADDRQPIWPQAMVGSITHTGGLCVAVVAERRHCIAMGIDSEVVGDVNTDIWSTICLATELAWIASLPAAEQAAAAALIFSAKEAFYKCQYPLTSEWLYFDAVRVEAVVWGDPRGGFRVTPTRPIAFAEYAVFPLRGEYLFHEVFVTAGIALAGAASGR